MNYKMIKAVVLGISMMALTGCVNQNQVQNEQKDSEKEVRIVATSAGVCNILDALEIDQVVGVPDSDRLPERYQSVASIGGTMAPDMEVLKSLNPTIVLSPKSLEGDLASSYTNIGVSSAFLNLSSVQGMYQSIKDLGKLFEKEEKANELVKAYEEVIASYQERNQEKTAPKVLILMGLPGSYVVATNKSYVGNLVELAGGENVYGSETSEEFLNINTEDMIQKNPDIILRTAHAMPEQVQEMFKQEFTENDIWKNFSAVQNNQVYDLDYSLFGMSATFAYQEALTELEAILYQ